MVHEIIIGVIGSIIGAILCAIVQTIYRYIKFYRGSEYSGIWEDTIPAKPDGTPEKHDTIKIKHNKHTNELTGRIKRTSPPDQANRNWVMNGIIDDGYLIISFWHNGPQKSNGCVYAKLTADNEYTGYYLEDHDGVIDQTPITLKKKVN